MCLFECFLLTLSLRTELRYGFQSRLFCDRHPPQPRARNEKTGFLSVIEAKRTRDPMLAFDKYPPINNLCIASAMYI